MNTDMNINEYKVGEMYYFQRDANSDMAGVIIVGIDGINITLKYHHVSYLPKFTINLNTLIEKGGKLI